MAVGSTHPAIADAPLVDWTVTAPGQPVTVGGVVSGAPAVWSENNGDKELNLDNKIKTIWVDQAISWLLPRFTLHTTE